MDAKLTADEIEWLSALDTDAPQKPDLPHAIAEQLISKGLAIRLVEGGLQMTALGREYLTASASGKQLSPR